jgi:hypothetical protein
MLSLSIAFVVGFSAGLLVGIKHAKRGQAIKDALKK